jgi:hypothetical protein
MTAAQLVHFLIVIGLGILAFLTFLVAGTILGLMIVEDSGAFVQYPIGLYVLGVFWILLFYGAARELIDGPFFTLAWVNSNQEALILTLLILFALIIVL